MKGKTIVYGVRMEKSDYELLELEGIAKERSVAYIIKKLIKAHLAANKKRGSKIIKS